MYFVREEMNKMENVKRMMTIDDADELYDDREISAEELFILACDILESCQPENLTSYKDDNEKQTVRTLK